MRKSVLITGGSGLLGTALTNLLLQKGYQVSHLGRKASVAKVKCFRWSVAENYLDPDALQGVDVVIHLAGAGVAERRWSAIRKKEILESRTLSSRLLVESLRKIPNKISTLISASAIGYYGLTTGDDWCREDQEPGADFLAFVTKSWEKEILPVESLGKRLVIPRIGVVLSNDGGALVEMSRPIKWFVGAPLGSGRQWMSWIHIDDLCRMLLHFIEHESMSGIYNAVAPNPVTNRELTKQIAKALHRPLLVPAVPEFVLKFVLGEMTQIVINGAKVSCEKILSTGFRFKFTNVETAIESLS